MWKYIRILLPLIVLGFIVPMIMPGQNGKPIMSPRDWLPDEKTLEKITESVSKVANTSSEIAGGRPVFQSTKKQLYKWQDKEGNWQFTDNYNQIPDYALSQLQAQDMPSTVNSMVAPTIVEATDTAETKAAGSNLLKPDGSVDISKAPELMTEAKKVRAQLEARNKVLEKL
ncbi:hypothetical protein [Dasania marina]|uniref:hypothetical protein n=1 Tax=Dasania marina TaxID=471499 RepID=UPI0030D804CB|tara:strand:- start:79 stop:591 length:513 start_codon:yes stop_codon:yes gene_type:complete